MKINKFFISLCLLLFCSCATIQGNRKTSILNSWWPTNDQWHNAVVNAASHPRTWVPLIGTVVIFAGGWDQEISAWAIKERPVYQSQTVAQNASDILVSSAHVGMILSSLAVPSGEDSWLLSTSKRIFWEHVGVFVATSLTDHIKSITNRNRPNGAKGSFPSWHATRAAAYAGMGYRNLGAIEVNPAFRYSAQLIFTSLVAGTAWARIEAGQHYPTDVLFGAALGNFISIFFHDAFLGYNDQNDILLQTDMKEEIILVFETRF